MLKKSKINKEPELSQKMGEYKTLKEKYHQELFYDRLIKMYNNVLKTKISLV